MTTKAQDALRRISEVCRTWSETPNGALHEIARTADAALATEPAEVTPAELTDEEALNIWDRACDTAQASDEVCRLENAIPVVRAIIAASKAK